MELILMIRAAKRASASKINVVIPYFGYARQDRKTHSRVPISASDIAMILEDAGASRIIAVDLHAGQIQGFFRDIPVDNLAGSIIFAPYVAGLKLENPVIVSPDAGGVERAKLFRDQLDKNGVQSDLAMIIKQRKEAGVVGQANLVGDVKDKDAIIIDDMCDTGGTLVKAAEELKRFGAKRVYACITHPVFSGNAVELIAGSQFDKVITTDTIPLREEVPKNLIQLSVAPMIAEVIRRVKNGDSVSVVFQPKQ
jgi:ribose-phosphate pyrophosphokinase